MIYFYSRTCHRKKCTILFRIVLMFYFLNGVFVFRIFANTVEKSDSLIILLRHEKVDSVKASLLKQLGFEYLYSEPAKTIEFCQKAITLFTIENNLQEIGRTNNLLGSAYFTLGEYTSAFNCFKKANTAANSSHDSLYIAKSLNNMGGTMQKKGQLDKAVEYYVQALHLYELMGNTSGAVGITNNIGAIYRKVGSLDKALLFYNKSIVNAEKSNDERSLASIYQNICAVYAEQKNLKEALIVCNKSFSINQKLNNQPGLVKNYIGFGNIYSALKNSREAADNFLKALNLSKSLGFRDEEASALLNLGHIELEKKKFANAKKYLTESFKIAEELDNTSLQLELSNYLYTVDSVMGDYKMAVYYLQKYQTLNNQLKQFNPEMKIAELEQKYEMTRQENLLKEGEIKKGKSIILFLVLGSFFLFFVGLLIIQHLRFRSRQRITTLTQQNLRSQMNPHFIFNILNSLHSLILKNDKESSSHYLVKFARLLRITLDNSQSQLLTINEELEALKLYLDLESLRHNHKLEYYFDIDEEIDVNMFKIPTLLLQPYIENSIIHGFREMKGVGKLNIEMKMNKNAIHCSVTDNGIGRIKAIEVKTEDGFNHKSYGSKITETRINLINSLYGKKMSVKYIDLYDNEKNPCGTKVEFNLPILT